MATIHHPDLAAIPLSAVLSALSDPLRLGVLKRLACPDEASLACGAFCEQTSKSRMSHHLRVLREAGLIRVEAEGSQRLVSLRRDELEQRFPGLLDAVLEAEGPV